MKDITTDLLEEKYGITEEDMAEIGGKIFDAILPEEAVDAANRVIINIPSAISSLEKIMEENDKAKKVMLYRLVISYVDSMEAIGALSDPTTEPDKGMLQ